MLKSCLCNATHFLLAATCWLVTTTATQATLVTDDFSYGITDNDVLWEGNSQYNSKWDGNSATQKELFHWASSGGNSDAAGRLDVSLAERNYIMRNTNDVGMGDTVTISSDFQLSITGDPLTGGQDGTDDSLIGLQLATTPNWWDGTPWFDFSVVRRTDSTWGVNLDGTIMGSLPNSNSR